MAFCIAEVNSSVLSPDERDTQPPYTTAPAIHVMETNFDEEDYPTEVCFNVPKCLECPLCNFIHMLVCRELS